MSTAAAPPPRMTASVYTKKGTLGSERMATVPPAAAAAAHVEERRPAACSTRRAKSRKLIVRAMPPRASLLSCRQLRGRGDESVGRASLSMLSRQMLALGSRLYEGLVAVRDAAKLYELGEGVHCRAVLE